MNLNAFSIDQYYQPAWLPPSGADALLEQLSTFDYRVYGYRKHGLKRAPKLEFHVPFADGSRPVYRFGQHRSEYAQGRLMTDVPLLEDLRQRLLAETGEQCNHCIVIEYADGKRHHAPPHHDRQQGVASAGASDMAAGTSFFVVTVGYARPFQLLDEHQQIIWSERLPHGSLLQVTATMNQEFLHAVPRDPEQPAGSPRYSAIFRTIHNAERVG